MGHKFITAAGENTSVPEKSDENPSESPPDDDKSEVQPKANPNEQKEAKEKDVVAAPSPLELLSDKTMSDGEKFVKFRSLVQDGQMSNKEVNACILHLVSLYFESHAMNKVKIRRGNLRLDKTSLSK